MSITEHKFSNETKNTNAQCKIVIFPWVEALANPNLSDDQLSKSYRLDISSQIQSCTVSKNMGQPSGSFNFTLTNSPGVTSQDWKDIIKRGFWCLIYMSNDGDLDINPVVGPNVSKNKVQEAKKLRCIGYIDRVGVEGTALDNRSIDIGFQVSGRDFGVIYEETTIWHNMFQFDKILLESIKTTKLNVIGNTRINNAIDLIHDLFYFPANIPGVEVNNNKSLLSIGLQWLLPKEMLLDLGFKLSSLSRGTYWGALPGIKKFSPTGAGLAVNQPTDYLSGNAWDQLKRLSIPEFHELFCETDDDGKPALTFRPIPWGINQSKYPKNSKYIKLYKELGPIVTVPSIDLYTFNLGEDDHSRYNSFLATVSSTLINVEDNISLLLGKSFPKNNSASIRRHGFRAMHVTVDSIVRNEELANGSADMIQLLEFNEILYDYWNNAIFADSGNITKLGTNDIKIGKVLKFGPDVPYLSTKRYYIEAYTDTYAIESKRNASWTQDVSLTRGFEEQDLIDRKGFSIRNVEFSGPGEFTRNNK